MGCGKTTTAKRLSNRLKLNFLDLDEFIEAKYQVSIKDIFQEKGEEAFREIEREALHATFALKDTIISTGGGTPCFFDNIEQINKNGISIYLEASVGTLVQRLLNAKVQRPLIVGKSKNELSDFIMESLYQRERFYKKAYISVDVYKLNFNELIRMIRGF